MSELVESLSAPSATSHPDGVVPALLDEPRPAALLRGTARGLEIVVWGGAPSVAICAAVSARLAEAPGFFRGSDVVIRVEDGPLAPGCLGRLDELSAQFELRIVEVMAVKAKRVAEGTVAPLAVVPVLAASPDAIPRPDFAAGSAPLPLGSVTSEEVAMFAPVAAVAPNTFDAADEPTTPASPLYAALCSADAWHDAAALARALAFVETPALLAEGTVSAATAAAPEPTERTRVVMGPVRSGVILEHPGHLILFGDVNPGAEVRATGNIVVLGRLRGTAHAGIGATTGFILALRLEPQQLRIGRKVSRAGDSDTASTEAEIAYVTGESIVVERYQGRLPRSLADSI